MPDDTCNDSTVYGPDIPAWGRTFPSTLELGLGQLWIRVSSLPVSVRYFIVKVRSQMRCAIRSCAGLVKHKNVFTSALAKMSYPRVKCPGECLHYIDSSYSHDVFVLFKTFLPNVWTIQSSARHVTSRYIFTQLRTRVITGAFHKAGLNRTAISFYLAASPCVNRTAIHVHCVIQYARYHVYIYIYIYIRVNTRRYQRKIRRRLRHKVKVSLLLRWRARPAQLHVRLSDGASTSDSTWMGDHQRRPGAVHLGLFIGVELNL